MGPLTVLTDRAVSAVGRPSGPGAGLRLGASENETLADQSTLEWSPEDVATSGLWGRAGGPLGPQDT